MPGCALMSDPFTQTVLHQALSSAYQPYSDVIGDDYTFLAVGAVAIYDDPRSAQVAVEKVRAAAQGCTSRFVQPNRDKPDAPGATWQPSIVESTDLKVTWINTLQSSTGRIVTCGKTIVARQNIVLHTSFCNGTNPLPGTQKLADALASNIPFAK